MPPDVIVNSFGGNAGVDVSSSSSSAAAAAAAASATSVVVPPVKQTRKRVALDDWDLFGDSEPEHGKDEEEEEEEGPPSGTKKRRVFEDESSSEGVTAMRPVSDTFSDEDALLAELACTAAGDDADDAVPAAPESGDESEVADESESQASEDEGEAEDDDDGDGDGDEAGVGAEAEADAGAGAGARGESEPKNEVILAKAMSIVSFDPPVVLFKCGKGNTQHQRQLRGSLVREVSSPLFTFVLSVLPPGPNDDPDTDIIESIVSVKEGPCVTAEAVVAAAQARNHTGRVLEAIPVVRLNMIRGAVSRTGFFGTENRAAQGKALVTAIQREMKAVRPPDAQTPISRAVLEAIAPPNGSSKRSWAFRNVYEKAEFFARANFVGGRGVHAVEALDGNKDSMWKIIQGEPGGLVDDPDIDGPEVLRILDAVMFASKLEKAQEETLWRNLRIGMSVEVQAKADIIRDAAHVYHKLPRGGSSFGQEAIVYGDQHQTWPTDMRTLLAKKGVFTKQRDGSRWYACWNDARSYYESLSSTIGDNITYVQAEADDDHDTVEGGYISKLSDLVGDHAPNIVLLASRGRLAYLRQHAGFSKAWQTQNYASVTLLSKSVIVVDRAHQLSRLLLRKLLEKLRANDFVEKIYLCGATLPSQQYGVPTLFSNLYGQAKRDRRISCTTQLPTHKVADGQNPTTHEARQTMRYGVTIFVKSGINKAVSAAAAASLLDHELVQTFPGATVTTPYAHARDTNWNTLGAAIIILTPDWTVEELAIVWQCTSSQDNVIWFYGPLARLWKQFAMRTRSSRPSAGAALLS